MKIPKSKGLGDIPYLSLNLNVPFMRSILVIFLVSMIKLLIVRPSIDKVRTKDAAVRNIHALISPSVRVLTPLEII